MIGVRNSIQGLINNDMHEFEMDVDGWAQMGGAELGTTRKVPSGCDTIGVRSRNAKSMASSLSAGPATKPCSISSRNATTSRRSISQWSACPRRLINNLPGTELCVGSDTALNNIVDAMNKIKQSAVASGAALWLR